MSLLETNSTGVPAPAAGSIPGAEEVRTESGRARFEAMCRARSDRLRADLERALAELSPGEETALELCCGHGHFLVDYAAAHPEQRCVGVDYSRSRIRRAVRKQEALRLPNLRFVHGEVGELLSIWPRSDRVARVFILFPDPWPKRRHRKYRVLSPTFLDQVGTVCRPGAMLYFRTDADAYFNEVSQTIERHRDWIIDRTAHWTFDRPTVFQLKASHYRSLVAAKTSPAT